MSRKLHGFRQAWTPARIGALTAIAVAGSLGCRSVVNAPLPQAQIRKPDPATAGAPAASRAEEPRQRFESAVRTVLDAHNFVPPVFLDGPESVRWAVSTRIPAQGEAVLALVKLAAGKEISVELVLYAHVGSTWALLGPEFRGQTDQEARQMEQQVREGIAR